MHLDGNSRIRIADHTQSPLAVIDLHATLPRQREVALLDVLAAGRNLHALMVVIADERQLRSALLRDESIRVGPRSPAVESQMVDEVRQTLVLHIDGHLAQGRHNIQRGFTRNMQVAVPHAVDCGPCGRGDDLRSGMDDQSPSAARDDPSHGIFRTDTVETHRTLRAIERHGAADMQRTVRLKDLPGERPQAKLKNVAVGGLFIDIVEPFEVEVGLTQRRDVLVHALGMQIHPVRHVEIEFQQIGTGTEQLPQRASTRRADAHKVAERDARKQVESIDGLNRDGIGRRCKGLGVEIGGDVTPPIQLPAAENGDPELPRVGGEEREVAEVFAAEDVDGCLRRLDRNVELVAALLPGDLQRCAAIESHLLGRTRKSALGNLHAPQYALVPRPQLRPVFHAEFRHTRILFRDKGSGSTLPYRDTLFHGVSGI